ncbi:MAG: alcohol dehydrogenase family protein [Myxococcota bacterium]
MNRALVYHGKADVRVESLPDPTPPDPRGVVVRVERTAICGSDLHLYHGNLPVPPGFTLGHEFVGEIVEAGSEVRKFRTGDRVIVSGVIGCGECRACAGGQPIRCVRHQTRVFGNSRELPGGQAEAAAVPVADTALLRVPDGISIDQAVLLTDILPTGYYGARNADIEPGQSVAVIGLGPVGQCALQCAQLFGPSRVFAIDRVPSRLEAARACGGIPIDGSKDPLGAIRDATNGQGPDAVIEAVGADETIALGIQLVRVAGVLSVIGVNTNMAFPFPMLQALMKALTFRIGICPVPELWGDLVPLLQSGRLSPERVFTHRMPLSKGAEAYALFDARSDGVMKVMLDPSA